MTVKLPSRRCLCFDREACPWRCPCQINLEREVSIAPMTLFDEQETPKYEYKAMEKEETTCQKATSNHKVVDFHWFPLNWWQETHKNRILQTAIVHGFSTSHRASWQFELNREYDCFATLSKTGIVPKSYTSGLHLMAFAALRMWTQDQHVKQCSTLVLPPYQVATKQYTGRHVHSLLDPQDLGEAQNDVSRRGEVMQPTIQQNQQPTILTVRRSIYIYI